MIPYAWKISSQKAGPTVAIFGGMHGDEPAGIAVIKYLKNELKIESGSVYLVLANPEAIERGERVVDGTNLNRCLEAGSTNPRAIELMKLLDECDAALDLHEHHDPPQVGDFLVTEEPSFAIARQLGVSKITYGWAKAEPGATDSYMYETGKIGITYEAGSITEDNTQRCLDIVQKFLVALGNINGTNSVAHDHEMIKMLRSIYVKTHEFQFAQAFTSFDQLVEGQIVARDGEEIYKAGSQELIVFPRPNKPIGAEACLIGKQMSSV